MAILENFEPKNVFHYFEEICGIPHGSGNTKQISDYLVNFAKEHDLKYVYKRWTKAGCERWLFISRGHYSWRR